MELSIWVPLILIKIKINHDGDLKKPNNVNYESNIFTKMKHHQILKF